MKWLVRIAPDEPGVKYKRPGVLHDGKDEDFELEDYPRWFPDGDIFAIKKPDGYYYLCGPELDNLPTPQEAQARAATVLARFFAIGSILWNGLRKPKTNGVYELMPDGSLQLHSLFSGTLISRGKTAAALSDSPGPTDAQKIYTGVAKSTQHLQEALEYWATGERSWFMMYKVLEAVGHHLYGVPDKMKILDDNAMERFKRSADNAKVSGMHARHAERGFAPLNNPMTLEEGEQYIHGLLDRVLRQLV